MATTRLTHWHELGPTYGTLELIYGAGPDLTRLELHVDFSTGMTFAVWIDASGHELGWPHVGIC